MTPVRKYHLECKMIGAVRSKIDMVHFYFLWQATMISACHLELSGSNEISERESYGSKIEKERERENKRERNVCINSFAGSLY